jgi:beta-glucosidase
LVIRIHRKTVLACALGALVCSMIACDSHGRDDDDSDGDGGAGGVSDGALVTLPSGPLSTLDLSGLDTSVLGYPPVPGVEEARARAADIVLGMTFDEQLALVHGGYGDYVGNLAAAGPLPALGLDDGPAGVARFSGVTAFPAPITLAATWDRALVRRWGSAMGAEQRGKGVAVQLGPMMNMTRAPLAGRNFESFGEDPYLASELAAEDVRGIQENGVVATAKHFVGNEQETNRETESSVIDERTLHEVYYAPFEASVAAGVGAVMCSYNRLNGTYACENPRALADLRNTLGFSGWVMSDWNATHSGAIAAAAGLDQEMPTGSYFGSSVFASEPELLEAMATRIVTSLVRVGVVDDPPPLGSDTSVITAKHGAVALEGATSGITLLKNENGALPIEKGAIAIAVFGTAGGLAPLSGGGGSAEVMAPYIVSPSAAIADASGGATVSYSPGESDPATAATAAADSDVAIVVLSVASSEFTDRPSLSLTTAQNALVEAIAAANPRTIVVLDTPGAVLMPWLDSVAGVLAAWYPGQENGKALASVLFGDTNPSGKLPVTFPADATTLPVPGTSSTVTYSEGLAIGHRYFDANELDPLFEFGFGLSYTTFAYDKLVLATGAEPGSVDVAFELQNTGDVSGTEVAQLYLTFPEAAGEPPRVLRGFERVTLAAGAKRTVHIELPARAFGCWNPMAHARFAPSGAYSVAVGSSSRKLPLHATLDVLGLGAAP